MHPAEAAEPNDRYRTALASAYEVFEDGAVLPPFPRLFLIATR